jgi:thiamine biosynthesis lipoprotein
MTAALSLRAPLERRAQPLLGTLVEIAVPAADADELHRWTDGAFARIAEFHAAMSYQDERSDVAAICRAEAGQTISLQRCTADVLRLALEIEQWSDGAFNIAVADELQARERLPCTARRDSDGNRDANATLPTAGECLRLDHPRSTVSVIRRVAIDLGGIAKGAAVDAAVAALKAAGAPSGCVNAGGDLAVFGALSQRIAIRAPAPASTLFLAGELADAALATSAPPLDGGPSSLVAPNGTVAVWADRSVTVIADTWAGAVIGPFGCACVMTKLEPVLNTMPLAAPPAASAGNPVEAGKATTSRLSVRGGVPFTSPMYSNELPMAVTQKWPPTPAGLIARPQASIMSGCRICGL